MTKVLVVIDMQNDFIDGALGTEQAKKVVSPIVEKLQSGEYDYVFATRDTHYSNYLNTHEGKKLPVPHCIMNTKGWEIQDEIGALLEKRDVEIINKPGFGSYELIGRLVDIFVSNHDISFEFVGLCTDICVVSNVMMLRGALPEADIAVAEGCCAGVSPESHKAAIETMKMCHIDII